MFIILDINECEVQPCQNNGTCIDLINNYQCDCMDGFNGTNCTTGKFRTFLVKLGVTLFQKKNLLVNYRTFFLCVVFHSIYRLCDVLKFFNNYLKIAS